MAGVLSHLPEAGAEEASFEATIELRSPLHPLMPVNPVLQDSVLVLLGVRINIISVTCNRFLLRCVSDEHGLSWRDSLGALDLQGLRCHETLGSRHTQSGFHAEVLRRRMTTVIHFTELVAGLAALTRLAIVCSRVLLRVAVHRNVDVPLNLHLFVLDSRSYEWLNFIVVAETFSLLSLLLLLFVP